MNATTRGYAMLRTKDTGGEPHVVYHPKSSDASPERMRSLAGVIELTGPTPSKHYLDGDLDEDEDDAGDRATERTAHPAAR
jgi:hypothetical protein